MMTSKCFVWKWLPGNPEPVVAGELRIDSVGRQQFVYGRSYLERDEALPIYDPELPLRRGVHSTNNGLEHFSSLRDAAPDAWGRRVIENRFFGKRGVKEVRDLDELTYLLSSGSDRTGALDFQDSAMEYFPRDVDSASLEELQRAAELLAADQPIPADLDQALHHGTSIGGARPKAAVTGDEAKYVAKFSVSTDTFPIVKAEYFAMLLAGHVGLDVAPVSIEKVAGKEVLLVKRFDRERVKAGWIRRPLVSALTVLGLDERWAREATYPDLVDKIRVDGVDFRKDASELFSRLVFNVLIGNTDDHARNHSFFVDRSKIHLTPAYDLTPFPRSGGEAGHGMKISRFSNLSRLALCLEVASEFGLADDEGRSVVEAQIQIITEQFEMMCQQAGMTPSQSERLRRRAVLNPDIFAGCDELNPKDW